MPDTAHPALEAERERSLRAQYAALTAHYGEIGSAALQAALIYKKKNKETADLAGKKAA